MYKKKEYSRLAQERTQEELLEGHQELMKDKKTLSIIQKLSEIETKDILCLHWIPEQDSDLITYLIDGKYIFRLELDRQNGGVIEYSKEFLDPQLSGFKGLFRKRIELALELSRTKVGS